MLSSATIVLNGYGKTSKGTLRAEFWKALPWISCYQKIYLLYLLKKVFKNSKITLFDKNNFLIDDADIAETLNSF